ncbi:AraC-type DNA-binding protein [Treponema bryantii]|uniref:AraC-type DNA-binding protein n=1 Tax=Treponema bryantii TaxID=163 RepID=A0A1I3KSR8_9SPIR|nr:AraC family transcriptional regulator [Treponema bryantii]SFI75506.1 AraC-type DNA-binding protein [Treponema bryantii]
MQQENRIERQPVAVSFLSQNNYPEEPLRQIEYEILYVDRGSGQLFMGNAAEEVHEGDFIFINSFEEHTFKQVGAVESFHCYRILFDVSALGPAKDSCRNFFEGIRLCRFLQMPESLMVRLEKIASMKKDSEGMEVILRSVLLDIIAYAIETEQYERFSQIIDNEKRNISAIDNALHYIRENYSENLSLGIILQLTNYSKSHFIRLFKECTGMNVSEYINKYRIEKACLDLIYTNNNITEIATASGFNNIQYFSRKFKEYMKCTPKQYQKKKKKLLTPE